MYLRFRGYDILSLQEPIDNVSILADKKAFTSKGNYFLKMQYQKIVAGGKAILNWKAEKK